MGVTAIYRKEKFDLPVNITVKKALNLLGFSTETHLVVRNGELLTDDAVLREGDEIKLIAVISGGSQ